MTHSGSLFKTPTPRSHTGFRDLDFKFEKHWSLHQLKMARTTSGLDRTKLKEECTSSGCDELYGTRITFEPDFGLLCTGHKWRWFPIVYSWIVFMATLDADKSQINVWPVFWRCLYSHCSLSHRLYSIHSSGQVGMPYSYPRPLMIASSPNHWQASH